MLSARKFLAVFGLFFLCNTLNAQTPNVPGDFPDPSIIKVGDTYYTSATSSNWMPAYPILKSKDKKNWEWVTNIFPEKPGWADHYFWAPELSYENGKVYVYYTARRKGGALSVAVASADHPEGPYKDHGPLVEQPMGSIDGFPMRDETGKLYLIWKEDGNSQKKPTITWIQEMDEERTKLLGERKELFRNTEEWERNLIEGASFFKHNEYYYAIYAAAGCCGLGCTYATGVARSKSLHGPWEKYTNNPLLTEDGDWKCQGHGTAFKDGDKYYFMYHGYHKNENVYTGRQGLLKEFTFTPEGWIAFKDEFIYDDQNYKRTISFSDNFSKKKLAPSWNWSVFNQPSIKKRGGKLYLQPANSNDPVFLGQKTYTANYEVVVTLRQDKSTAEAGAAIIGDDKNYAAAIVKGRKVQLVEVRNGKSTVVNTQDIGRNKKIKFKIVVSNTTQLDFHYAETGNDFKLLGTAKAEGLPPWDRALRAGLISKGTAQQVGIFDDFSLQSR